MSRLFPLLLALLPFSPARGAVLPGEDWRYRDIIGLIAEHEKQGTPFRSPDELIAAFPAGLKKYFTFVYETGSKFQDASPLFPRALVFNRHLVYTFNGHPAQKGYNTLELMELDGNRIELREITFEPTPAGPRARYGHSTPTKCLQCHGSNPHPIWAEYNHWPGVYGSDDDDMPPAEEANYRGFLAKVRGTPESRYARLTFPSGTELPPYPKPNSGYFFRINLLFSKLITRFAAQRLLGVAQQSPYYERFKWLYPLVTYEYSCHLPNEEGLEDRARARILTALSRRGLHPNKQTKKMAEQLMAVWGIPVSSFNPAPGGSLYAYTDGSKNLERIFADTLVRSLAQEDPALGRDLELQTNYHIDRYLTYDLYEWLDPQWPIVTMRRCAHLIEKARAAMSHPLPELTYPTSQTFAARLARAEERRKSPGIPISCVYCHTGEGVTENGAPLIPFDDERALSRELSREDGQLARRILSRAWPTASPRDLMPPPAAVEFSPLSRKEWEALRELVAPASEARHPRP